MRPPRTAGQRYLRGNGVQDHRDRGRQQDTERPPRGDYARCEAGRVAALAHLRNSGAADRRARRRTRSRHGREQRAGEDVGDAQPARNALHPCVHREIEVPAGVGPSDRRSLQDEERNRQERDARHLLVDVLRHGVERGRRHEEIHEQNRDEAERERDRHPRKHHDKCDDPEKQAQRKDAHRSRQAKCAATCSSNWTTSSVMPDAIKP